MKNKVIIGCLFVSIFIFGGCRGTKTDTAKESPGKVSTSIVNNSTKKSTMASSNTETSEPVDQNNLSNEELAIAAYIDSQNINQSLADVIDEQIDAYGDTGYSTKLQLSKTQLPDIIVSHSSMASTQRFHFEEDVITSTFRSNSGDESQQRYSAEDLNKKYGIYKRKLDILVTKAENYSPLEGSTESFSESTVDTKNLSSEQFKEWVSAVLDKQFSLGRSSFPYKLSVENHDGYAYVRVKHSELQVDTITMFRINGSGQLEEEDRSNGYPVTYKVVSSKFMDISEVTMQE